MPRGVLTGTAGRGRVERRCSASAWVVGLVAATPSSRPEGVGGASHAGASRLRWAGVDSTPSGRRSRKGWSGGRKDGAGLRQRLVALGAALVTVTVVGVIGYVVIAGANQHALQRLTVRNDTSNEVSIQPCERFLCDSHPAVMLQAGSQYRWETTRIRSFVVSVPDGRVLGCLMSPSSVDATTLAVSRIEDCVT